MDQLKPGEIACANQERGGPNSRESGLPRHRSPKETMGWAEERARRGGGEGVTIVRLRPELRRGASSRQPSRDWACPAVAHLRVWQAEGERRLEVGRRVGGRTSAPQRGHARTSRPPPSRKRCGVPRRSLGGGGELRRITSAHRRAPPRGGRRSQLSDGSGWAGPGSPRSTLASVVDAAAGVASAVFPKPTTSGRHAARGEWRRAARRRPRRCTCRPKPRADLRPGDGRSLGPGSRAG